MRRNYKAEKIYSEKDLSDLRAELEIRCKELIKCKDKLTTYQKMNNKIEFKDNTYYINGFGFQGYNTLDQIKKYINH